ncbi:hypothetical protein AXF05_10040 [Staphylococcus aureus]|nr:hypothetical protein [Staphylococcus aureus]
MLSVGATPTCIACINWGANFSVLGPHQLALK